MNRLRDALEQHQVLFYIAMVMAGAAVGRWMLGASLLDKAIKPALALMLFVTFLQVPLAELGRAFTRLRFLGALLASNFVAVPLLLALASPFLPSEPLVQWGLLLVLMAPCIDYVVTFSHIGRADARLLLAATPALLMAQLLLLPVYLRYFLGDTAASLLQLGPFIDAFLWLIAVPLLLAVLLQRLAARAAALNRLSQGLGLLPVPATGLVLFIVVAAVMPQLSEAAASALTALPFYLAFAVIAPFLGWGIGRLARLDAPAARAVAFSTATRNSLVILPLALAVPGALPVLPAVIVTQTLVELIASLAYMRWMPKLGAPRR